MANWIDAMHKPKMTRTEKTLFIMPVVAVVLVFTARWATEKYARVPFQAMPIASENSNGNALIYSKSFGVTFEGQPFMHNSKCVSGNPVDGRFGLSSRPWEDKTAFNQERDDLLMGYSQATRLLTIKYRTHLLDYSHHFQTLEANGQEYSTADAPVHLIISKNSAVRRIER